MLENNNSFHSFATLAKENPDLFRIIYEFNYLIAAYVHPTRQGSILGEEIPERIWHDQRTIPILSSLLLKNLALNGSHILQRPTSEWCYVLLPLSRFRRLAVHIGAVMLGSIIRSSIVREDVLKWKKELGEEVFSFVMNRGKLFVPANVSFDLHEVEDIERLGGSLVLSSLEELPASIASRAQLKLHAGSQKFETDVKTAKHLVNSVLFTLEKEWHFLFATTKQSTPLIHQ